MPDDQNSTQNPISDENSIPASPQEPMADAPILPIDSEPTEVPSDALESSPNDFSVKSNDIPPSNSTPTEAVNEPKTEEKPVENEPSTELISEPVQAIKPSTAQMAGNEPLTPEPENKIELNIQEVKPEPVSVSNSGVAKEAKPESEFEPKPEKITPVPIIISNKNKIFELLAKAKNAIQFRKRKKLDRVMTLFLKKSKITNDEVEKFLHVSDATATRYLSQLEKENKIKQVGKTGHAVSYSRI
jgi:hypothetical protein